MALDAKKHFHLLDASLQSNANNTDELTREDVIY